MNSVVRVSSFEDVFREENIWVPPTRLIPLTNSNNSQIYIEMLSDKNSQGEWTQHIFVNYSFTFRQQKRLCALSWPQPHGSPFVNL